MTAPRSSIPQGVPEINPFNSHQNSSSTTAPAGLETCDTADLEVCATISTLHADESSCFGLYSCTHSRTPAITRQSDAKSGFPTNPSHRFCRATKGPLRRTTVLDSWHLSIRKPHRRSLHSGNQRQRIHQLIRGSRTRRNESDPAPDRALGPASRRSVRCNGHH